MSAIDDLNAAVAKMTAAVSSAATELQKLADAVLALKGAGNTDAAVEAAATALSQQADALSASVASSDAEANPPAPAPAA